MGLISAYQRIVLISGIFVADLLPSFVLDPCLPKEVSSKPRNVSALFNVSIDCVAHGCAPVFIMANENRAGIARE